VKTFLLLWACYASYEPEKRAPDPPESEEERDDPIEDSALWVATYVGEADLSVDWSGIETTRINRLGNGQLLCAWQSVSAGVASADAPCVDADDRPCEFAFDVSLTEGGTVEGDCRSFGTLSEEAGPYSYGYIEAYTAGGISYGPSLLFYYRYAQAWMAVPGSVAWDANGSSFFYEWEASP